MPPMMSKMVAFPADWLPVYELFKEVRSRQLPAVISCFDGCPRPKRISGACEDAGLLSWSLDIRNSPKEDLGEDIGIQKFLDALSQCAHDSLLWLAPECCTWVWINRHSSGRRENRVQGLPSRRVMQANTLANVFVSRAILAATAAGTSSARRSSRQLEYNNTGYYE